MSIFNDGVIRSQIFELEKVEKAFIKACEVYKEKYRRINGLPYVVHLQAVLMILKNEEPNILAACLLADILDDSDYSYQQLGSDFNFTIAQLVKEMSNSKKTKFSEKYSYQAGWLVQKRAFLKEFPKKSETAKLILTAKHIHNLLSLLRDYQNEGEAIWEKLQLSKRVVWSYYDHFFVVLTANFHHVIIGDYYQVFAEAEPVFGLKKRRRKGKQF